MSQLESDSFLEDTHNQKSNPNLTDQNQSTNNLSVSVDNGTVSFKSKQQNSILRSRRRTTRAEYQKFIIEQSQFVHFKNQVYTFIWGSDHNLYNFVTFSIYQDTFPFCLLQTIRMVSFLCLLLCTVGFFYIQVRYSFNFYQFHVLLISTLAFLMLFVEGGKQKCHQMREQNPGKYPDVDEYKGIKKDKKQDQWVWGIVFYSMAVPMALVSNFVYFVPFNKWLSANHQNIQRTVKDDTDMYMSIYHDHRLDPFTWRKNFNAYVHFVPVVCLAIECILNKIIYPFTLISATLGHSILYLVITIIAEKSQGGKPIFPNNLNWGCSSNWIYLQDDTTKKIYKVNQQTCAQYFQSTTIPPLREQTYKCYEFFTNYFCKSKGDVSLCSVEGNCQGNEINKDCWPNCGKGCCNLNNPSDSQYAEMSDETFRKEYSAWDQCYLMATIIIVMPSLLWLIFWFVHNLKKGSKIQPYSPKKA